MRNFLIGLVVGVLLVGLTMLVLVFAAVRFAGSYANRPANVSDGSTLVLDLSGDVPERLPAEIPIPILQSQTAMSVEQVWDTFRRAATDSRIRGILFEPHGLDIGWAKMEEIHDEIVQFKKSGKPIITYLRSPTAREYYLASATDKIFISPEDSLDLKGLRAESMYFKQTLDKLGVKAEVIHAGQVQRCRRHFHSDFDVARNSRSAERDSRSILWQPDRYRGGGAQEAARCRARADRRRSFPCAGRALRRSHRFARL